MEAARGYFDLNLSSTFMKDRYKTIIEKLYSFGYRTIAINYDIAEAHYEEISSGTNAGEKQKTGKKRKNCKNLDEVKKILEHVQISPVEGCEDMKILHRLTLILSTKNFYQRMQSYFNNFDILAIQPVNSAAINMVCTDLECDILLVKEDIASNRILRKHYRQLVAKGIYIEMQYKQLLTDSERKNFIKLAHSHHTVGKLRNIILSSGASDSSHIRKPYDIVNMAFMTGLSQLQSKAALLQNCRNVYYHAVSRKSGKISILVTKVEDDNKMEVDKQNTTTKSVKKPSINLNDSIIEITDNEDDEVSDVGHKLKKIKT